MPRGGKREGAGRKSNKSKREVLSVRLDQETLSIIPSEDKAKFIENAIKYFANSLDNHL